MILDSPLVSAAWLEKHLADSSLRILECTMVMQQKDDGTFAFVPGLALWQESHIPNSIYVDVAGELSDPDHALPLMMPAPETLAATFRQKGIGDGTAVVCYDRGNHAWAARVWWLLRACGFDNAAVLDGGWKNWCAGQRPVTTAAPAWPVAPAFTVSPRPALMAGKAHVKYASETGAAQLLHSLPLPMFTGEVIAYARPGRIPGSKHLFCEALLDENTNCFRDPAQLGALYASAGIRDDGEVIAYCGGGVAASANALALTLIGHRQVAVYDGSLSEWAADPALPMETG